MAVVINGTTGITAPALDLDTPLPVADGGTGATSNAATGYALKGANSDITSLSGLTTALSAAQGGTGVTSVGTAGNVLTSNGSAWVSQAAGGGSLQAQLFTSPGTWTKPSTVSQVRVTVVGGGGGASLAPNPSFPGGTGGTSSFGPAVSATGGVGNGYGGGGTPGTGTVSVGTALKSSFAFTNNPAMNASFGSIAGYISISGQPSPVAYSASSSQVAGAGGISTQYTNACPGLGGIAQAIVPVSAPVAVTVGSGGTRNGNVSNGNGGDGAVLVEFVG